MLHALQILDCYFDPHLRMLRWSGALLGYYRRNQAIIDLHLWNLSSFVRVVPFFWSLRQQVENIPGRHEGQKAFWWISGTDEQNTRTFLYDGLMLALITKKWWNRESSQQQLQIIIHSNKNIRRNRARSKSTAKFKEGKDSLCPFKEEKDSLYPFQSKTLLQGHRQSERIFQKIRWV